MADPVSIVVASYNYETFIEKTLQSILAQTLPGWEALVVDDGSTDNSVAVINRYCALDSRFRLLQHAGGRNRGLAESLRLGIGHATGDWIAFCESDDWWEPAFLEEASKRGQETPDCGVVFTDVLLDGESVTMQAHCAMVREHFRGGGQARTLYERMQNAVPTMSCAMARAELIRTCDFDARFPPSLDMWLWAQLVVRTGFSFVDRPLCHWRQHETSYMKKEIDPSRLDMSKVIEFHDEIRGLLGANAGAGRRWQALPGAGARALNQTWRKLQRLLRGQ